MATKRNGLPSYPRVISSILMSLSLIRPSRLAHLVNASSQQLVVSLQCDALGRSPQPLGPVLGHFFRLVFLVGFLLPSVSKGEHLCGV